MNKAIAFSTLVQHKIKTKAYNSSKICYLFQKIELQKQPAEIKMTSNIRFHLFKRF